MPDSSPELEVDDRSTVTADPVEQTAQVSDAKTAESSAAEPKATMLEAVKTALQPKEVSPTSQEPGDKADAATADPKAEGEPEEGDELSPDELKALSQKTQTRFKRLTSNLKAKDQEIEGLRPKAQEFERISKFVSDAGLSNQELDTLFNIGALMKNEPAKALDALLPYVQALQNHLGQVLPPDLQEQVRMGYIAEDKARELAQAKAGERIASARADQLAERQRRDAAEREQNQLVQSTLTAMETWEAKKAERDPDWHLKRREVSEKVELAVLKESNKRGSPWFPTATEAAQLAEAALKDINARFKRSTPPPKAITPVTGNSASSRSTVAPKSMMDVVRNAVAAA